MTAASSTYVGPRRPRLQFTRHLAWLRTLPCLITGRRDGVQAAHIRYGDRRYAKRPTGFNEKPDDRFAVPLHHEEHLNGPDAQHKSNERDWWRKRRIDPLAVANALYCVTGDDQAGEMIIQAWREDAGLA